MKRFFCAILCVMLFTYVFAQVNQNDVVMVSYEHSCKEKQATLLLKNNTEENISSIRIKITYRDMSGNKLDSLWFDITISIEPRKTQEVDVGAFRYREGYYYYKSQGDTGNAYKIDYDLICYSTKESGWHGLTDTTGENTADVVCLSPLVIVMPYLLIFLLIIGIFVGVYWIVVKRRKNENEE